MNTHKWIWKNVRADAGYLALQTAVSVAVSLSFVWFALVSRQVVDIAVGTMPGNMWHKSGLLLGILLAQALLNILGNMLQARTAGRVEMRIKERIFTALFHKQWQPLSVYPSGDLLNRLTGDVTVVVTGVVTVLPQAISLVTRLAAGLTVLLMMDRLFALLLLVGGTLLLLAGRLYGRKAKGMHAACQQSEGDTRFFMQECLENRTVIQSFDAPRWVRARLQALQHRNYRHKLRRALCGSVTGTTAYVFFSFCYFAALAWGAWRLAAGTITFGTLTAFLQIVQQVQTPFRNMSGILPQYYHMLASAERLMELEALPDDPPAAALPETAAFSALVLSGVTFAYDRTPVLRDATLVVRRGECVAIAGDSGIGKSTFFKLLLGFLQPAAGEIRCETTAGSVPAGVGTRRFFSYVPQENLLLSGTIRQNLTFCCGDVTEEDIWTAAEAAAIAGFIRSLPQGLDTVLGERGLGLSEGQLQRLAIARGVLYGAPVLLLDEATSALDAATERQVLAGVRALPDVTCICITHRPAALEICDRLIYLCDGKFKEAPREKA